MSASRSSRSSRTELVALISLSCALAVLAGWCGSCAATLVVFGTGVALLAVGPEGGIVLGLHKASFFVWLGALGVHVLVYALRVPGLVVADWGRGSGTAGAGLRVGVKVIAFALLLGLTVALAALPAAGTWLHWSGGHD